MERSTQDAWLQGSGDLSEAEVEDVPVPGQSVRIRALSAKWSAQVMAQTKLVTEGREQVAKIDVPAMEALQFAHGCIEPTFTLSQAEQIQEKWGAAFRKVVAKIDELSGIDKEAITDTEARFPAGGTSQERGDVGVGSTDNGRPDLPVRTGA